METFLQILGAALLIGIFLLLLLVLAVVLIVRAKFKKFSGEMAKFGELAQQWGGSEWSVAPARITLRRTDSIAWNNTTAVDTAATQFRDEGFQDAGMYTVDEMPGLKLRAFHAPETGFWGVVYEREPVGVWTDCVFRAADGGSVTATNAPAGHELDHRPNHDKIYLPGSIPLGLIQEVRQAAAGRAPDTTGTAEFAAMFQRVYAEEMDWRNSRGGPTEDEIRRIAERSGIQANDEIIKTQRELALSQAIVGLDIAVRERYLEQNALSAAEWDRIRNRVVFVHDRLTPDTLRTRLYDWNLLDEDDDPDTEEFDTADFQPRAAFERFNAKLHADCQFRKLAEVHEPVQADVYLAPHDVIED